MKPVATSRIRQILRALGCTMTQAKGSHEKWTTPGGLSDTIVSGHKEQAPGTLQGIQRVFAPEFGEKWLERELSK